MEALTSEVFNALRLLTPGFIAAWVLGGLTVDGKKSDLQRIVQALIFSVLVQILLVPTKAILVLLGSKAIALGDWSSIAELSWSVALGSLLGCLFAWLVDSDKLYSLLRKLGVTKQSSRPSVWYSTFSNYPRYVVLHLEDGRRIYGWPQEWSSCYPDGHVRLINATWLQTEGNDSIDLPGELVIVRAKDIAMVEFVQPSEKQE